MSEDRLRQRDFFAPTMGTGSDYLGAGAEHHRDYSLDQTMQPSDSEAYDMTALHRQDSRSPLHLTTDGYALPSGANPPAVPGIPYGQTPSRPSTPGRVHYPPPSQMVRNERDFTVVPLDDGTSPVHSGANTPASYGGHKGNKSKLSAFLKHGSSASIDNSTQSSHGEKDKFKHRPKSSRTPSWDMLGSGVNLSSGDRAEWEDYNLAESNVENLRFAEGDAGTTKLSRFYYWALNRGIAVRWALYILPVLVLLWIPGIVGVTADTEAKIWSIKLIWWSIWLTIVWCGFWAATAAFMIVPHVWRQTIAVIIPSMRAYTDVVGNLGRYAKLVVWAVVVWISFTPLLINHFTGDQSSTSRSNLTTFASILFGIFLCSIVLGVEKFLIQLITLQFHRDSYADRLREQKFQLKALTTLYIHSHDIPGRTDTLIDSQSTMTKGTQASKIALRKALKGLKTAAQTTTTALGNVASEMTGSSVLQTNSPANKITYAIASANKSKALARRLFYSFREGGADHLDISDIVRFFPDLETAQGAFQIFDRDGNGDATRDEIESAILQIHRDKLSLEASMRDTDGAVRRLDDIFMVIVIAIDILILAAMVTTKLTTFVTSAGTFILGLSWLIGTTMQEILLACIFLFVKHPYDVGDRVDIDGNSYTVAKMELLSTSFRRVDGKFVWIGHNILSTKVIENVRRSGATSESFSFEVAFDTNFEQLQVLRAKMLKFCKDNSRDYLPIFDVIVDDFPAQGKMTLKADIKYKSNWQQGALKVQRRNKWVCQLKITLAELKIWGPAGAGNPTPDEAEPTKYTLVPYEDIVAAAARKPESPPPTFQTATAASLVDKRGIINDESQDIWDEQDELNGTSVGPSRATTPGPNSALEIPSRPRPEHTQSAV